jgi:hypothetical protein
VKYQILHFPTSLTVLEAGGFDKEEFDTCDFNQAQHPEYGEFESELGPSDAAVYALCLIEVACVELFFVKATCLQVEVEFIRALNDVNDCCHLCDVPSFICCNTVRVVGKCRI